MDDLSRRLETIGNGNEVRPVSFEYGAGAGDTLKSGRYHHDKIAEVSC